MNQSIYQSVNQSIIQPINQSINQSINQPTNQPINQSINQSTNIAPLHGLYSEFLPNQTWSKRKILRCLRNDPEESHEVDRRVGGRPFQRVGPTTEKDLKIERCYAQS